MHFFLLVQLVELINVRCYLLACVKEYFEEEEIKEETLVLSEDTIYNGYKTVLDSKSTDESLVSYLYRIFLSKLEYTIFCISVNMCYIGNVCKLGAKTYKTLSKISMETLCQSWICSSSVWLYCCCSSWLLKNRNSGDFI